MKKQTRRGAWDAVLAQPRVQEAMRQQQERQRAQRSARAPQPTTIVEEPRVRGRQPNKTEQRWLTRLAVDPTVKSYHYEGATLKLAGLSGNGGPAKLIRYTPDVLVEYVDGSMGFDEIKGAFVRDLAVSKYEWARQRYPGFRWRWCQWVGGQWRISTFAGCARLSEATR